MYFFLQQLQVLLDAKQRILRGESLGYVDGQGGGEAAGAGYASNVAVVAEAYAMAYAEPADASEAKYGGGGGQQQSAYDSKYDYDSYRY